MAIQKIDAVSASTDTWVIQVADVTPVTQFVAGQAVQQTRKSDGTPRWLLTLLVQRPGEGLAQLDLKPYAQVKPDFSPGDAVKFVGDSVIARPWGMAQGDRARTGLWFEGEIEAA